MKVCLARLAIQNSSMVIWKQHFVVLWHATRQEIITLSSIKFTIDSAVM